MNIRVNFDLPTPRTGLLIGGEWVRASKGMTFATLNPATEETIAEVAQAGASEIDAAVAAARRALKQGAWAAMSGAERGRILNRLAAILRGALKSWCSSKASTAASRSPRPAGWTSRRRSIAWNITLAGPTRSPGRWSRRAEMP